jgi:hypothetical protein
VSPKHVQGNVYEVECLILVSFCTKMVIETVKLPKLGLIEVFTYRVALLCKVSSIIEVH